MHRSIGKQWNGLITSVIKRFSLNRNKYYVCKELEKNCNEIKEKSTLRTTFFYENMQSSYGKSQKCSKTNFIQILTDGATLEHSF